MTEPARKPAEAAPAAETMPLLPMQELGFVGLAWLERSLAAWFAFGREQSAHAAHAARDLSNAYSLALANAVTAQVGRPDAGEGAAAAPATDRAAA